MQAAAEGVIDFSQVVFWSRKWTARTSNLVAQLARKNRREVLLTKYSAYSSWLGLPAGGKEWIKECAAVLYKWEESIRTVYDPAEVTNAATETAQAVEKVGLAKDAWEQEFGSLNDPVVQKRIEAMAAKLLASSQHQRSKL